MFTYCLNNTAWLAHRVHVRVYKLTYSSKKKGCDLHLHGFITGGNGSNWCYCGWKQNLKLESLVKKNSCTHFLPNMLIWGYLNLTKTFLLMHMHTVESRWLLYNIGIWNRNRCWMFCLWLQQISPHRTQCDQQTWPSWTALHTATHGLSVHTHCLYKCIL